MVRLSLGCSVNHHLCSCDIILGALQGREFPALAIECKTDLAHPEPTEANPNPKRKKDPSIVSADVMAVRMRRFAMGLVETSVRTESGKRAARAAFKWVIRSILRGQGSYSSLSLRL